MLSITKPFTTTSTTPSKFLSQSQYHHHHHVQSLTILAPIKSSNNNNNNITSNDDETASTPAAITPPPLEGVEIRFRRGSRKRRKEQEDGVGVGVGGMSSSSKKTPPKDWESMTITEKALELYVGEKGLLFWLNKFAYASIFIIIGLWILFRFVGPALNLYQLDAPPLSPTSILKG